jgi:hypothetical protein
MPATFGIKIPGVEDGTDEFDRPQRGLSLVQMILFMSRAALDLSNCSALSFSNYDGVFLLPAWSVDSRRSSHCPGASTKSAYLRLRQTRVAP